MSTTLHILMRIFATQTDTINFLNYGNK
jgi:hypothetical protein